MEDNNQIKFALYLEDWDFETGNKKVLKKDGIEVTTTEYTKDMKGHIFCPECSAGLFRSPEEKDYDTNGRKAFYAHSRKHQSTCSLRVKKAPGKRYDSEEIAQKAIEDEELVVVKGFMKEKPKPLKIVNPQQYQGEPVEDIDGDLAEVPIGRHNGETFSLPSRITTVRGLCRNFNKNLYKYFHLPGRKNAVQLKNLLIDIRNVKETDEVPKFYFAKVSRSWNCGPTPQNIRQTMFEYPRGKYVDFCLKATDEISRDHGIDDDARGKIVIMFGTVTKSGIGLSIEDIGWGEFAVLPDKYAVLLY
ncbi:hypothetical protein [Alteromonas macleodii]|jgi:hypothetical protein|uniref:hypothetical protein n=1 Tax=Alteromonas macleodii TaxID=28108 RepID=UPI001280F447|nr:hypothetical protein [Alteromonas macleodii]CAI2388203.1 hypothetical protein ALT831_00109 [Alteromonas macleodii]CAI3924675.1 hypothetical protein ALTBGP6_00109 [Alteromonas macleodii]CAI3924847.1 hypothetical protein ALTBGP14_00109 [Alteromonas macleodii]CAI3924884.1 hypothetical protein ALTBGP9_00109 [Alteromonas macleodii]VTO37799.1 hypothetical protein ALTBGP6_00109 [Alteromonas macleodii]